MAKESQPLVPIYLPADLLARLDVLKQDRDEDRDKSAEELIHEFCQRYVAAREAARHEQSMMEELERSYRERPADWDDAEDWAHLYLLEGEEP